MWDFILLGFESFTRIWARKSFSFFAANCKWNDEDINGFSTAHACILIYVCMNMQKFGHAFSWAQFKKLKAENLLLPTKSRSELLQHKSRRPIDCSYKRQQQEVKIRGHAKNYEEKWEKERMRGKPRMWKFSEGKAERKLTEPENNRWKEKKKSLKGPCKRKGPQFIMDVGLIKNHPSPPSFPLLASHFSEATRFDRIYDHKRNASTSSLLSLEAHPFDDIFSNNC